MDDIFRMCTILDNDGSGDITLDEFLHYFQHLDHEEINEFEQRKAEEELFENTWPEWVVKDGKLEKAK